MRLEPNDGGFTIEAADLAELLGMPVADVQALMRSGAITTRSERGEEEDTGRFRVTFIHDRSQVRLIVTGDGNVLQVSRIIWPSRPDPTRRRCWPGGIGVTERAC